MKLLSKDARLSAVEIAESLAELKPNPIKLSSDAVLQRIKKLESDGIIRKYITRFNYQMLGVVPHKILIYFSNPDPVRIEAMINFCRQQSHVIYLVHTLGDWDFEINVDMVEARSLYQFLMDLSDNFSGLIRKYEILIMQSIPKSSFYFLS